MSLHGFRHALMGGERLAFGHKRKSQVEKAGKELLDIEAASEVEKQIFRDVGTGKITPAVGEERKRKLREGLKAQPKRPGLTAQPIELPRDVQKELSETDEFIERMKKRQRQKQ